MSFKNLKNDLLAAQIEWEALISLLSEGNYDFSRPRPTLHNQPFTIFSRKARLIFECLLGLLPGNEKDEIAFVVAGNHLQNLINYVGEFFGQTQAIRTQLQQNWRSKTSIVNTNDDFIWYLTEDNVQYTSIDLSANFQRANELINALLTITSSILPFSEAKGTSDLSKRADAIGLVVREVDASKKQAKNAAVAAQESADRAAASEKQAKNTETEADVIITTLRTLQTQASADVGAGSLYLLDKTSDGAYISTRLSL